MTGWPDLRPQIRAAYDEAQCWKRYDRHLWETQGILVSRVVLDEVERRRQEFVDKWGPVSMLPPDYATKLVATGC